MFVISKEHLKEDNLEVNEYISLLVLDGQFHQVLEDDVLKVLQEKGLIKLGDGRIVIRQEGNDIINKYSIDEFNVKNKKVKKIYKKSVRFISNIVEENVEEFRKVFKGLKTGSMGDSQSCKEKLTRWMNAHPEVSIDKIIKAAKIYVGSVDNMRYLQRADYFIYKVNENKEETSTLSSIIDDVTEGINPNEDWTSSIN